MFSGGVAGGNFLLVCTISKNFLFSLSPLFFFSLRRLLAFLLNDEESERELPATFAFHPSLLLLWPPPSQILALYHLNGIRVLSYSSFPLICEGTEERGEKKDCIPRYKNCTCQFVCIQKFWRSKNSLSHRGSREEAKIILFYT